jgi:hypothetical protein
MGNAAAALFDNIVTKEYSSEIVDMIHKMLNKVLVIIFF